MKENKIEEWFVEKGADLEHSRWAKWQKYMFSKMYEVKGIGGEPTGDMTLPKEFVDRWFLQIDTPYSELSEEEKESDRKETRNYLSLLTQVLSQQKEEIQDDINSVLNMLDGDTDRKKIANFIREYLVK